MGLFVVQEPNEVLRPLLELNHFTLSLEGKIVI